MGAPQPQSGWYPDPAGMPMLRYFDGTAWTGQLAPMQASAFGPPPPVGAGWGPPTPKPKRGMVILAVSAAAAVLAAGGFFAYHHVRSAAAGPCPVTGARPLTMKKKTTTDPTITIPATAGWELIDRSDLGRYSKELDSPLFRGVVANTGITENEFTPNIVVTQQKVTDKSLTVDDVSKRENKKIIQAFGTIDAMSAKSVCGNPVYRTDFSGLDVQTDGGTQSGTELLTVTDAQDGDRWMVTVTLQTRNPSNPEYVAERDALVTGFHVGDPTGP